MCKIMAYVYTQYTVCMSYTMMVTYKNHYVTFQYKHHTEEPQSLNLIQCLYNTTYYEMFESLTI